MSQKIEINQFRREKNPLYRITANTIEPGEYAALIQVRGVLVDETGKKTLADALFDDLKRVLEERFVRLVFEVPITDEKDNDTK